jgi:NADPH2:quinone reductase
MQILLSEVPGGPGELRLRTRPDPVPKAGEVRVSVRCVGINFPDTLIIKDLYQFKPERPFAPGAELSGVVDMVGDGVTSLKPGDRVMALPMWGALAEMVCLAADRCHRIPDKVDFASAAALQMTYGTALYALEERADLRPDETVLVLGAAGGVGLAAVELAKVLGARVVAAASSDEKVQMALSLGADLGIVYSSGPLDRDGQKTLTSAIRDAVGPGGVDIIVDTIGGAYTGRGDRA